MNFNDKTSSFKVGAGARVRLCRHSCPGSFRNSIEVVGPYNINDLNDMDNTISTYQSWTYDETDMSDARVSLFGQDDYACPYCGVFTVGTYS